jgi:hypothetical protein
MEFLELIKLRSAAPRITDGAAASYACVGDD